MSLTLDDIANMAGVSRSTVSRVLNQDPNVNEKTRQHVQKIMDEIQFQPNLAARRLATGRTGVLGLVIPTGVSTIFTDPFFPMLIQSVSAACITCDYTVMLWLTQPEYEHRTIQQILYSGLIDGVIVSSMNMHDPIIKTLSESRFPFITVGRHPAGLDRSYVDVDNLNGAREGVMHLLRQGRRRIATITGPQDMLAGRDRLAGYQEALKAYGSVFHPALVIEGDFSDASGYYGASRLLVQKPDAIFAASDMMAIGAMRALSDAGLRVPDDVAIIGFDDIPQAARTLPPLTTIRQQIQRTGALAVETLVSMIEKPSEIPHRIILPTELVVRASCGAIPLSE